MFANLRNLIVLESVFMMHHKKFPLTTRYEFLGVLIVIKRMGL